MKSLKYGWLALLVVMSLLLTACGGTTGNESATATTGGATGGATAAATDTTAAGGAATAPAAGTAMTTETVSSGGTAEGTGTPAGAAATDTPATSAAGPTNTAAEPTAVAACNNTNAKTTITIWHGWGGAYLSGKQPIFAAYCQQHPDVNIKLLQVSNIDTKVQNAVPAGVGPDIVAWVDDHIGQNALIGVIDPLDGKGGIDANYLKQNYPDVAVNAMTYNGQIYGLPETMEAITFIYNKKLITADKLPKNTTDMIAMAKAYNQANPGKYFVVWDPNNAYSNAPWFYGAGGEYVDPQGNAHLDTPEAIATAKFMRSLQGLMPKDINNDAADALFNDGKAAIELSGPWRIADLKKAGIDFGLAKIPAVDFGKGGPARPFVGVKCLMLAHGSKNADVAVDIMKFYTSAEQEQTMAKATGEVPAATAAYKALSSDPVVEGFGAQAQDGVPLPNTPFMNALWDPAAKAYTALWTGTDDPTKIMQTSQQVATSALAKMK